MFNGALVYYKCALFILNDTCSQKIFFYAVQAVRKFNVNAVECSSVLRVTCRCFVCVFVLLFLSLLYFFVCSI